LPSISISAPLARRRIPNLVGLSAGNASSRAEAAGFSVSVRKRYSNRRPGIVLSIRPKSGRTVAAGATVTIFVSRAPPTVPNVLGKRLLVASREITKRGFKVEVHHKVSTRPAGTVVAQTPKGGTK